MASKKNKRDPKRQAKIDARKAATKALIQSRDNIVRIDGGQPGKPEWYTFDPEDYPTMLWQLQQIEKHGKGRPSDSLLIFKHRILPTLPMLQAADLGDIDWSYLDAIDAEARPPRPPVKRFNVGNRYPGIWAGAALMASMGGFHNPHR